MDNPKSNNVKGVLVLSDYQAIRVDEVRAITALDEVTIIGSDKTPETIKPRVIVRYRPQMDEILFCESLQEAKDRAFKLIAEWRILLKMEE